MTDIEQILRRRIGLEPVSVGTGSIQRAIRLRMKALGVASPKDYEKRLRKSQAEWTELMESVVVTETWFFRDRDPFDAFVQFVKAQLPGAQSSQRVRILSVPCASGEEPYSLVMALLDAGVAGQSFEVDAADISPRALLKAKRAIYSRNSFRGKDLGFKNRYFHENKEGFVLCPAVRSAVRFFEANILNPDFLAGHGPYDVIFCRNLLIYFDRQTQARALSTVSRMLSGNGLLVVGAVEQSLAFENGFKSANIPLAFACRKLGTATSRGGRETHPVRRLSLPQLPWPETAGNRAATLLSPKLNSAHERGVSPASLGGKISPAPASKAMGGSMANAVGNVAPNLGEAQRLANDGKFSEAAELCEQYLRGNATSAQAWYLLGLIRDATADPLSVECYRKALYLEPRHYESLLQMALLSEKSGDLARARTFKRRAAQTRSAPGAEEARV